MKSQITSTGVVVLKDSCFECNTRFSDQKIPFKLGCSCKTALCWDCVQRCFLNDKEGLKLCPYCRTKIDKKNARTDELTIKLVRLLQERQSLTAQKSAMIIESLENTIKNEHQNLQIEKKQQFQLRCQWQQQKAALNEAIHLKSSQLEDCQNQHLIALSKKDLEIGKMKDEILGLQQQIEKIQNNEKKTARQLAEMSGELEKEKLKSEQKEKEIEAMKNCNKEKEWLQSYLKEVEHHLNQERQKIKRAIIGFASKQLNEEISLVRTYKLFKQKQTEKQEMSANLLEGSSMIEQSCLFHGEQGKELEKEPKEEKEEKGEKEVQQAKEVKPEKTKVKGTKEKNEGEGIIQKANDAIIPLKKNEDRKDLPSELKSSKSSRVIPSPDQDDISKVIKEVQQQKKQSQQSENNKIQEKDKKSQRKNELLKTSKEDNKREKKDVSKQATFTESLLTNKILPDSINSKSGSSSQNWRNYPQPTSYEPLSHPKRQKSPSFYTQRREEQYYPSERNYSTYQQNPNYDDWYDEDYQAGNVANQKYYAQNNQLYPQYYPPPPQPYYQYKEQLDQWQVIPPATQSQYIAPKVVPSPNYKPKAKLDLNGLKKLIHKKIERYNGQVEVRKAAENDDVVRYLKKIDTKRELTSVQYYLITDVETAKQEAEKKMKLLKSIKKEDESNKYQYLRYQILCFGISTIKEVYLISLGLSKVVDMSPITNLKKLQLQHNYITTIKPLQNNVKLETLYLHYNALHDLDGLYNLQNLQQFSINENQLNVEVYTFIAKCKLLKLKKVALGSSYFKNNQVINLNCLQQLLSRDYSRLKEIWINPVLFGRNKEWEQIITFYNRNYQKQITVSYLSSKE